MPSLVTHAAIGVAAGLALADNSMPARFYILSVLCAVLPDADIAAFFLRIPYHHFLGHRGFFHSFTFAFLLGLMVVCVFFSHLKVLSLTWFLFVGYFFLLTALHCLLDAFTNGRLGVALFSPFDNHRYFFSFRPIMVSPISVASFFTNWGLQVMVSEMLWVWLPLFSLLLLIRLAMGPVLSAQDL